jgi:hypothetical protein
MKNAKNRNAAKPYFTYDIHKLLDKNPIALYNDSNLKN